MKNKIIFWGIIGIGIIFGAVVIADFALEKKWLEAGIWDMIGGAGRVVDCGKAVQKCIKDGEKCVERAKKIITKCDEHYEKRKQRCAKYEKRGEKYIQRCERIKQAYSRYIQRCGQKLNECNSKAEAYKSKYPDRIERYEKMLLGCKNTNDKCISRAERIKEKAESRYQRCLKKAEKRKKRYRRFAEFCRKRAEAGYKICRGRAIVKQAKNIKRCNKAKNRCFESIRRKCGEIF